MGLGFLFSKTVQCSAHKNYLNFNKMLNKF